MADRNKPTIRLERGEPVKVDGQWEVSLTATVRFGELLPSHPFRVTFRCRETNERYDEMTEPDTGRAAMAFYLDAGIYSFEADVYNDEGDRTVTSNLVRLPIHKEERPTPAAPKPAKGWAFLSGRPGNWRVNVIVKNDDGTPAKDVLVVITSKTSSVKPKTDENGVVSKSFTIAEAGAATKVEVLVPVIDLKDDFILRGPRRLPSAPPEGTSAVGRFIHNLTHSNNTRAAAFLAIALAWFAVNLFIVGLDARPTETMPAELQRVQNLAVHGQYKTTAEITGINPGNTAWWNWVAGWSWKFNFFFFIFAMVYAVAAMREEIGYAHQLAYTAYKNRLASAEIRMRREAAPAAPSRESGRAAEAVPAVGAGETATGLFEYVRVFARELLAAMMADLVTGRR